MNQAIFHLVPDNRAAAEALHHARNAPFVSRSANLQKAPGLEIGFHVPPFSRGHVITRMGRNADLILRESFSGVHVAFEMNQQTHLIVLSVRTKRVSTVTVALPNENGEQVSGDCALVYGQEYVITIASYVFKLVWRHVEGRAPARAEALRRFAVAGYKDSLERLKDVKSCDLSIPETSTPNSWYMTRLQSAKEPLVIEDPKIRIPVGSGAFGAVFKTVDKRSGNLFAVKLVDLNRESDKEEARARLHREIKILEGLSHPNIIECLGSKDFLTDTPLIFMPLRPGSLESLVGKSSDRPGRLKKATFELCDQILKQVLSGLDYLAFQGLCHRDIKPANILYEPLGSGEYRFQLADFGLANKISNANTICGSPLYWAPEIYNGGPQGPKVDIWSLFVTMAEICPDYPDFPPTSRNNSHEAITQCVLSIASVNRQLAPMARLDPAKRASAAQMLVAMYAGEGMSTPKINIPPITPYSPDRLPQSPFFQPAPARPQLVQLPVRRTPRRAPGAGMISNRAYPGQQAPSPALRPQQGGIRKPPAAFPNQQGFAELMRRAREPQPAAPSRGQIQTPPTRPQQPRLDDRLQREMEALQLRPERPATRQPNGQNYMVSPQQPRPDAANQAAQRPRRMPGDNPNKSPAAPPAGRVQPQVPAAREARLEQQRWEFNQLRQLRPGMLGGRQDGQQWPRQMPPAPDSDRRSQGRGGGYGQGEAMMPGMPGAFPESQVWS